MEGKESTIAFSAFDSNSQIPVSSLSAQPRDMSTLLENMSGRSIALSPNQAPSRDRTPAQSRSMAPANSLLASRPRTFDLVSEPVRIGGHDDSENSYIFASSPSAQITSNRIASPEFPTITTVELAPRATRNPTTTLGQETPVRYEITQRSLKFKGDVNGIKIVATQVASKVGQDPQLGDARRNSQPQGQGKPNGGFVNQNGAQFSQSVRDTETEVIQSIEGYGFFTVTQDAAEVEGEVSGGSFIVNQRVW